MANRQGRTPTYASTFITLAFTILMLAGALYVASTLAWVGFTCWSLATLATAFNTYRARHGKPVIDEYRATPQGSGR